MYIFFARLLYCIIQTKIIDKRNKYALALWCAVVFQSQLSLMGPLSSCPRFRDPLSVRSGRKSHESDTQGWHRNVPLQPILYACQLPVTDTESIPQSVVLIWILPCEQPQLPLRVLRLWDKSDLYAASTEIEVFKLFV